MTNIKLINENGVIKAIAPETGEEVPVEFDDLQSRSVSAESATIGANDPYEYISENHMTVTVPGDYSTIQAAIDDCPKNLRHEYIIDVDPGTYQENLVIRGVGNQATTGPKGSTDGYGTSGEPGIIQIIGDTSSPSDISITSAFATGCTGTQSPTFWGIEFSGDPNPHTDEDACVEFLGCRQGFLGDVNFASGAASTAVEAYGSGLHARRIDIGTDNFTSGVLAKRGANVDLFDVSGSATGSGIVASESSFIGVQEGGGFPSGGRVFNPKRGSFILCGNEGLITQNNQFLGNSNGQNLIDKVGGVPWKFVDAQNGIDRFEVEGKGWGNQHIENLSGQTGGFDGQVRLDDGTNTPHRAVQCVWDDANGVWVDQTDGSTFT